MEKAADQRLAEAKEVANQRPSVSLSHTGAAEGPKHQINQLVTQKARTQTDYGNAIPCRGNTSRTRRS
jgi:hypothetical protein